MKSKVLVKLLYVGPFRHIRKELALIYSFVFPFFAAKDKTQGLTYAAQGLYH